MNRLYVFGCALALAGAPVCAQSELFVIDFEGFDDETPISDQYAELGVTFAIEGQPKLLPAIALEGAPTTAFSGGGADSPMSSESGGLTDPIIDGDEFEGNNIRINFDPFVTSVRLFVIDIDGSETYTLRAFDGETEVAMESHTGGGAGTGNGVSTQYFLSADSITSVLLEVPQLPTLAGFAVDFLTFTRPCEGAACGPQIQISQESAPGAGDFDDNVLGAILAFPAAAGAAGFYAYGVPEGDSWNGQSLSPIADRSHLLLANTTDGLTLVVVHDRAIPDDPDGGRAEMIVELLDDADGAFRTVEDDPAGMGPDFYTGDDGETLFTSMHGWDTCCTDGFALSGLACPSSVLVAFGDVDGNDGTPAIEGILEWVAYSADGDEISLAMEVDRRVRLDVLPHPDCPADLNCDAVVNPGDLLILLGAWGPCDRGGVCAPDIDGDGNVGSPDLILLLGDWGLCP